MRDYLLFGLKAVIIILGLAAIISAFRFTRKGRITRKGLVVIYICFLLTMVSAWALGSLYEPSLALTGGLCLSSATIILSIPWAIKYTALPYVEKKIEERFNKRD